MSLMLLCAYEAMLRCLKDAKGFVKFEGRGSGVCKVMMLDVSSARQGRTVLQLGSCCEKRVGACWGCQALCVRCCSTALARVGSQEVHCRCFLGV